MSFLCRLCDSKKSKVLLPEHPFPHAEVHCSYSLCLCHSKFCGNLIPSPQHWSGSELICVEFVSCIYSINHCKFKSIFCSIDLCQLKQCTQPTKLLMCRYLLHALQDYLDYIITCITSLLAVRQYIIH